MSGGGSSMADLLNEVQILTNIKHQNLMDQLQQQVQTSNINNAKEAILAALPQGAPRTAYLNNDWETLNKVLPNSTDVIKQQYALAGANPNDPQYAGFDPVMAHNAISQLVTGMSAGNAAKSEAESQLITDMPHIFGSNAPTGPLADIQRQALSHIFTGVGTGENAVSSAVSGTPGLADYQARVSAGAAISAPTAAQMQLQADEFQNSNKLGWFNAHVDANYKGGMLGIEEARAKMATNAKDNPQILEWQKQATDALNILTGSGKGSALSPTAQLQYLGIYNSAMGRVAAASGWSPEQLRAMQLNPNDPDAPGKISAFKAFLLR